MRTWALAICLCAMSAAAGPPPARPTLTAGEIAAIPNVFPARLEAPADPKYLEMYKLMGEFQNPELTGDLVSKLYRLSIRPAPIVVKECGSTDAFYDHQSRSITICYEYIRYINQMAGKKGAALYSFERDARITLLFVVLHELGHALVHLLDLPTHASSEDMADEFAWLTLTKANDATLVKDLIRAPEAFLFHHGVDMRGTPDPTGKHRPGQERAFSALCMLYGRQPDAATGRTLGAKAEACIEDTAKRVAAWNRALAPHTRIEGGQAF